MHLHDNIDVIKKNTETLIDASKEVGLEVNAEKTKYMFLSLLLNARQNHDMKVANRCFENVAQFKYLGMTVTKRNAYRILVGKPEEMTRRPSCRWVDNIKMDLREIKWGGIDWIDLAQDRDQWGALVNMVINLRVP
jgi:hypothetical protein